MNLSDGEQYNKYPHILTLKKYWLEYQDIKKYPEYNEILSDDKIKSLYNVLKENTFLEEYINGKKWEGGIIEDNYILNEVKNTLEDNNNDEYNLEELQEEKIKEIFLKFSNKNYLEEKKSDLNLYRLFFSFANLRWSGGSSSETEDGYLLNSEGRSTKMIVSSEFYNPNFNYNDSWKYQLSNITPNNIRLLVSKELNFLLMEQDLTRFRKEESGLDSSQQLEYLKCKNTGNQKQETFSYIKHADLSKYDQSGKLPTFNPKISVPKKTQNFRPSIPFNKKIYGLSSSNLLTLQIVESLSYGDNSYNSRNNLTNTDILMQMREKNNLIGISSEQIDTYKTPSEGYQIPDIIDNNYLNINPRLYNKLSYKRIYR